MRDEKYSFAVSSVTMEIAIGVGGALLSASVQPLIERLTSHELNIFARREKILGDLKDWEMMLAEISSLLDDAEDTQMANSAVKIWLDEFRDLTYDIEDVLDEFNTEALKRKVMEDSQGSTNKLRKFIPTRFISFGFNIKMASRIKDITKRLQRINAWQKQTLNLRMLVNGTRSKQLKERPPTTSTTSLVDESEIYGRNDDKEAITKMLLCNGEGGDNSISVIPILGMGGIGKTTLAKLVYNDSAVQDYFDIKIWICVSENFDVIYLTRTILWYVAPEVRDLKDLNLNSLQETLKKKLSQKKFLLILDDVWEEDYNQWDLLRAPFISAASSSKIVVTTRKKNAAPITADVHAYHVKELPDEECLFLLAHHALAAQSFDAHLDLKDIGLELAKRCNGLPLAAKVLGGLLRNKRSREEWERVLRNKLWNSRETSNSVHPTLKLSYNDLPSHLKRCFVYCAIFPKDYEFDRDELVSLWMAEGFLHYPHGGKLMEDLGIEYFEDLVSRSLFQSSVINKLLFPYPYRGLFFEPSKYSRISVFVMHDLISDLAQTIAREICYNDEAMLEDDMSTILYQKVRHASFSCLKDIDSQEYEIYTRMKRLRTIVGFPIWRRGYLPDWRGYECKMLYKLLAQSKCARVLSLTIPEITKLPNSIGDLIHLRYINLSQTYIQQLPESVSSLFNLQTLLLCYCHFLKKLPDKIRNLVNLRHLDIFETFKLRKFPSGIGMLTNLQTLSKFIVKEGHGTTIAELKNLNNLRGSLSIRGLENVQDAKSANLKGKQGLEELELKWSIGHGRNDMSMLESLEPHQNLKRLTISSYCDAEFPSWINNIHLFSKLVSLTLRDCKETKLLPPLGHLCLLKELRIIGLEAVKTIGVEFYGNVIVPFQSLERLEIGRMSAWREWSHGNMGGEGFPNLQELRIYYCPKLIWNFPSGLPCSLKCIRVSFCDALECFPMINTRDGRESLLEELNIEDCSSLKYFERNFQFPTSLRKLTIRACGNLLSLPDGLMVQDDNTNQAQSESHLEQLEIAGCQGPTSFPAGKFPAALKFLTIRGPICMQLESAISEKNTALESIRVLDDDNLKALPSINCLPSLRSLYICRCPALESFPEMGFRSTSLQHLHIEECQNLRQPIAEWGLGMLSCLEILTVNGGCPVTADVVSFPDDNCCWLPTSLKYLRIGYFTSLESVSMGLQMLTSLKFLHIGGCPKLRSLPKEALPLSLAIIEISGCPLLKKKLLKGRKGLSVSYYD
ncbi:putative disease resistance protein At3g14460 [Tripterygium wilfordii]|uniref:putative disease resistance protein At3g14460 n=1 Tax=Tripterygium wilfordii TaxID=458696 RepID=UPI0018F84E97|nr:putative disease resistance protein At3g14460 [Tripterygium wilfordii]